MLIQGDAVRIPIPNKLVHTCVTSPPYWGLRKYSGDQGAGMFPDLGLEKTPQEHIERIVAIMAEVHRVLRDDGVVWLNYGDCYAQNKGAKRADEDLDYYLRKEQEYKDAGLGDGIPASWHKRGDRASGTAQPNIPAGNLMLMPHRIAIALQDWGWVVRNDVIWFKRNPMPESQAGWRFERSKKEVGRKDVDWNERPKGWQAGLGAHDQGADSKGQYRHDENQTEAIYEYGDYHLRKGSWRHTRAHEFIFMLTKKMQYWSNQEAVRERYEQATIERKEYPTVKIGGDLSVGRFGKGIRGNPDKAVMVGDKGGRNPRSVLDVPTAPYKGAHYATFPPNLIAPLIRATCPRWACPVCGQGWSPVVEKADIPFADTRAHGKHQSNTETEKKKLWGGALQKFLDENPPQIKSYRPTCEHEHTQEEAVPGVVLDPFVGSGTTVMVAKELLRRGIGLDISMEYLDEQAKVRTGISSPSKQFDELPLFAELES